MLVSPDALSPFPSIATLQIARVVLTTSIFDHSIARLKREEAAAAIRRSQNLNSLFASSDPQTPAPGYYASTTSLVPSDEKKHPNHVLESEGEESDGEGQYVTMPTVPHGGQGQMTGSTMGDGEGVGERVWQAESGIGLALGSGEGARSRLDLDEEDDVKR